MALGVGCTVRWVHVADGEARDRPAATCEAYETATRPSAAGEHFSEPSNLCLVNRYERCGPPKNAALAWRIRPWGDRPWDLLSW